MSNKQDFTKIIHRIYDKDTWWGYNMSEKLHLLAVAWSEEFPKLDINPYDMADYRRITSFAYNDIEEDILSINMSINNQLKHSYLYDLEDIVLEEM